MIVESLVELGTLPFRDSLMSVEEEYDVEISSSIVYYVYCSPSSSEVTLTIHSFVRFLFLLLFVVIMINAIGEKRKAKEENGSQRMTK